MKFSDSPQRHYWLHREAYEGDIAFPLLSRGYLCYGWVYCAMDEDFMRHLDEHTMTWDLMESMLVEIYQSPLARNRYCLWRFFDSMKKGDWVVVPSPGEFAVYEITDEKVYAAKEIPDDIIKDLELPIHRGEDGFFYRDKSDDEVDIGLVRKVKEILPRSSRNQYVKWPLSSRMKYQMANIDLDGNYEQLLEAINNAYEKKPISLRRDLHKLLPNMLNAMKECLEPGKFEYLVQWYFDKLGARTYIPAKNTPGKEGEEDIDVIANFDALKTTYYVQVKFHQGLSGSTALNQAIQAQKTALYRADDDYASVYWALTSADDFLEETKQQAKELLEKGVYVRLINGLEFMEMLLDVGLVNIDEAFKK